jgi:hypothetical protein
MMIRNHGDKVLRDAVGGAIMTPMHVGDWLP